MAGDAMTDYDDEAFNGCAYLTIAVVVVAVFAAITLVMWMLR